MLCAVCGTIAVPAGAQSRSLVGTWRCPVMIRSPYPLTVTSSLIFGSRGQFSELDQSAVATSREVGTWRSLGGNTIRIVIADWDPKQMYNVAQRGYIPVRKPPNSIDQVIFGHAMHDLDTVFDRFSHDARLAEIAGRAGLADPVLYQSMYIFKQPRVGGAVDWHQDAAFLRTDPVSVTAFWFALDDADRTNGCLWVQPGGHRSPQRNQFVVRNGKAELQPLDDTPWPELSQAVPVEVAAGTLVVFNGLLPHYSAPNRSEKPRHAYTLHAVDAHAKYADDNWLQRPELPLRGFR